MIKNSPVTKMSLVLPFIVSKRYLLYIKGRVVTMKINEKQLLKLF